MSDYTLTAQSALGGIKLDFEELEIAELVSRAIVSIAVPHGGEKALSEVITSSFKTEMPAIGKSTTSAIANSRFLGLQGDQLFLLFDYNGPGAVKKVLKKVQETAYLTDQSDSWVMITVSGPKARNVIQRTCPIDMHPSIFQNGAVARTVMDHLNTIIVCEGPNTFLLMSPRSSSKSFLNAVETSIRNL